MKRGGHIINVSSESVDMPFAHLSVYQELQGGAGEILRQPVPRTGPQRYPCHRVRAGSMYEEGKSWDVDPQAAMAFAKATRPQASTEKPLSQFTSVTGIFRALIDLPADLHAVTIGLHGRKP